MTEAAILTAEERDEEGRMEQAAYEDAKEDADQEELEEVIVLDDASAMMMVDRIREANEQYNRLESWYKVQLERAKTIRDRTVAWAERSLQGYLGIVPARETKTQKAYDLPGAQLLLKHQQPKYEVNDAVMVPWLKDNDLAGYVVTKETAAWGELKKTLVKGPTGEYFTQDGEVIPGLTVTQRPDEFQVKLK